MGSSAFEHPYLSGLVGDDEIGALFSIDAEIRALLAFEVALANSEAASGLIPVAAAQHIGFVCSDFAPDVQKLKTELGRDGVVIPELVKQLRAAVGPEFEKHVHFGATSQDIIDTGLMLRLKRICEIFVERLKALDAAFETLDAQFGTRRLMGYTRMQAAIPITVHDRVRAWREPLARHGQRLSAILGSGFPLQFGGAAGTLEKLGEKGPVIRLAIATELGLADEGQWQTQRDRLAEFAGIMSLVSGSLGKFGQDIALLAEIGGEIAISGGGSSSAMAHKQNPVSAEVLVTLGRFNAVQLSGMHQSLVHEQERSGAAWTLEWLILPPMVMATGASLRLAAGLVANIKSLGSV